MDGRRQIKAIMLKYNYFSNRFPVIFLVRPGSGRKHNVKKRKVIKIINTTQIV
jgi:hypothetical protein